MRWLACVCFLALAAMPVRAVSGRHGMVAAENPFAAEAGVKILRLGGNAVDAAVATALAVGVVNPTSCGLGGGGFMVIFDQASHAVHALDFRETAPSGATRNMFLRHGRFISELARDSGLAVAVPGEVAGLCAAHKRFGVLPFEVVAAPAIALARDGFPLGQHVAGAIDRQQEALRARPLLAALFLHPDGSPLRAGEWVHQPALAATLERVARGGTEAFYAGTTAAEIVDAVRAAGGVMTLADLAAYRPVWRRPLETDLEGLEVYGMPPPGGGAAVASVLEMVRADNLPALGLNSPTYIHLLSEAMRFAFADRAAYYGDPDHVRVPLARLLSPAQARARRHRISAATTFSQSYYGGHGLDADAGTSHLSVVDSAGNAVACSDSINTSFGALLVAGNAGVILNDTMDDFSAEPGVPNTYGLVGSAANAIAPGKRPLSSMSPTIVLRGGEVAAVLGGSGGPLITTATLQVLLNALVFGAGAEAAVAAPRVHEQWMPPDLQIEAGIDAGTRRALARLGHRMVDARSSAAVQLVLRSPDGQLDGAADPRKGGAAVGW